MLPQTAIRTSPPLTRSVPLLATGALDGSEREPLAQTIHLIGAIMSYPRNTEIFGGNEAADYVYKVASGSVRMYKILSDGRRQIGGFYMPGDIFGLEFADEHACSAEVMTDAKVLVTLLLETRR
jgi:CRP-like cAMP-binding protein